MWLVGSECQANGTLRAWKQRMTVRTSSMTVAFTRPFAVSGMDGMQPAGTYTIEAVEELLEGLSFPAYRRIATSILLPPQPGSSIRGQVAPMDPGAVEAAVNETS